MLVSALKWRAANMDDAPCVLYWMFSFPGTVVSSSIAHPILYSIHPKYYSERWRMMASIQEKLHALDAIDLTNM